MRLILGVVDVGYVDAEGDSTTTGDVAGILEAKYHPMRSFVELHENDIGQALANAMTGNIESLGMGAPPSRINLNGAMAKIEEEFRDFLDKDEMGQLLPPSQQSQAALNGVSHRKKNPNSQDNDGRPHFIDTGLYQASFRAWIENEPTE